MHSPNHWGGAFEIRDGHDVEDEHSQNMDLDQSAFHGSPPLDETQQGWLLGPSVKKRKERYADLGCIIVKWKVLKWTLLFILISFAVIGMPTIIIKNLPKHKEKVPSPDEYAVALHMSLRFFNAQKSGRLPKTNNVSWRGISGLNDGLQEVKGGLVGGYYDGGNSIKYNFPMAFSMTLLSWSVIEYSDKYQAIGEYDHIRELVKWGADYLLLTFNSSASVIDRIYSQVGTAKEEHDCWQRPEDINYVRQVETSYSAPDLGSEMAAALAAASMVFNDDIAYSKKLVKGAKTLFEFSVNSGQTEPYSLGNPWVQPFYNSTGYWDEQIWAAVWMFYATGNYTYLDTSILNNPKAFMQTPEFNVLSWDNKLPGARLLLTRFRIFINPGYPYEDVLMRYHDAMTLNTCSYLRQFHFFNWTTGGLIILNNRRNGQLEYAANAAFLVSLFADYMNTDNIPGLYCGPTFISTSALRSFAISQVDYILGANPKKISYVVGYGPKYPVKVHHPGASIPNNKKYTCNGGKKWYYSKKPNPNIIAGALVNGPDWHDNFLDLRSDPNYTEPTLARNAGLVASLVSLTNFSQAEVDVNTIFTAVGLPIPSSPPPPAPWTP